LEIFGDGGGPDVEGLNTSIDALIHAYNVTKGSLRPSYTLIGVAEDEPYHDLFLVDGFKRLVLIPSCIGGSFSHLQYDREVQIAGSLASYLHVCFVKRFINRADYRVLLYSADKCACNWDQVTSVARNEGLREIERTRMHLIAVSETPHDPTALIAEASYQGVRIMLGGCGLDNVSALTMALLQETDITLVPPRGHRSKGHRPRAAFWPNLGRDDLTLRPSPRPGV
jgi:hypothetical protein